MKLSPGLLWLAGAALLLGCGRAQGPLVIAAVGGWNVGPEERAIQEGMQLAVEQVNDSNAIPGRKLQLDIKEDGNDNAAAAQIAQQLVADPRVVAVIGHTRSDPTLVAMKVYDGVMPVISPRLSSPDIGGLSSWVFQLVPPDSAYAAAVVSFAARHNWRRAAVLFNNTARGRAQAQFFRQLFPGEIVSLDAGGFPAPAAGDVTVFAQYHKLQAPDMVFAPIGAERAQEYVNAAQQLALRAGVVGWDVWGPITSDPAQGGEFFRLVPFDLSSDRAETRGFVADYRARFNAEPDPFAALGYESVRLIAAAARERATRAGIRDALAAFSPSRPYPGVTGPLSFDRDGNVLGPQPAIVPLRSAPRTSTGS